MIKKLGVFLLSYKRPDYILESINSILIQDYNDFTLIISENTPDDSVVKYLDHYLADPRVQLIKRTPSLPSLEHFNKILFESKKYEYAMLFHDDDIMMPQALSKLISALEANKTLSAVACNALLIKNTEHTHIRVSPNITKNMELTTPSELINRYIFKRLGHTPFPSYIYRTKYLENLNLNSAQGGKYSDVSFLVKLIKRGSFFWLYEPLIKYRLHANNDTANLNMGDILSLSMFFFETNPKMIFKILFYFNKQLVKKFYYLLFNK